MCTPPAASLLLYHYLRHCKGLGFRVKFCTWATWEWIIPMVNQSITFWLTSWSGLVTERGMYVLSLARNLLQQCKICL
jgi:hypothetical protein